MKHRLSLVLAGSLVAASVAAAQTTIATATNFINSPFAVVSASGTTQTSLTGLVAYDINLSPVSLYVGSTQLAADAQAFFAAYPSPQDPTEAIVQSILSSILQKYPQINGGALTLAVISLTPPVGTKSATVYMGTLGPSSQSQVPPPPSAVGLHKVVVPAGSSLRP